MIDRDKDQLSRLGAAPFPLSSLKNESVPIEDSVSEAPPEPRKKWNYLGAPACFTLELACKHLNRAFPGRCYVVGSVLERPDFRDVDIRMMISDEDFRVLFPDVHSSLSGHWEQDIRWLLMTSLISNWLTQTLNIGKPVDFQFQPTSWGNKQHDKLRNPIGHTYAKEEESTE